RKITHPSVCRVFDFGEVDGLRYLTMELVEGRTLRALLREGRLGGERALAILEHVAAGLGAAHAQGIVHRDLKPENRIGRPDGRAGVMDSGLARRPVGEGDTSTEVAGTPAYMSPEQLRGEALNLRSDVFSLGILAFELLSGEPPFGRGAPAVVASAILRDPA